jgi:hypothetical protein
MSRLVCRCAGEIVPTDRRVQIRARKSEAADELHRAHAPEQVIELCQAPALPLQPGLFPFGWRSLCGAAANDDASTLACGGGDRRLVFTLERRVWDLKDIEDTHRDVFDQMGHCAGHPDKTDLAGFP